MDKPVSNPLGALYNLFRAEWLKVAGNRWVTSCLIWVFPIMGAVAIVVFTLIVALSAPARDSFAEEPPLWTEQALEVWNLVNNPVGRMILLGFTGVVFAGEYQWNTWKNTVPRNRRVALILMKFFTVGLFVVVAFVAMSIIMTLGMGFLTQLVGTPYDPKPTQEVLSDFAEDYLLQASTAFTATIIASGYVALAGMLTRSILGGVLIGFGITFFENLSIVGLFLLAQLLDVPDLVTLYRFTPGYNLTNVTNWINANEAARVEMVVRDTDVFITETLEFSLILLAVWVIGLITITALLFQRQDITT
ncbi:MAG: hypothetical protein GYB65_10885 [Chloroflexi bacterium]|nr:hypothetical protein [Chloroflexota bacterium]